MLKTSAGRGSGCMGSSPSSPPTKPTSRAVFRALMQTTLATVLKGKTVADLVPFSAGNDATIRHAAHYLETGNNPPGPVAPRYCVAAARLAARAAAAENGDPVQLAAALGEISKRTGKLIRENASGGKRSGGTGGSDRLTAYARLLGLVMDPPPESH